MNIENYEQYRVKTQEKITSLKREIADLEINLEVEFLNCASDLGFYIGRQVVYKGEKWLIEKAGYWTFKHNEDKIWLDLVQPNKQGKITSRCKKDYTLSHLVEFATEG